MMRLLLPALLGALPLAGCVAPTASGEAPSASAPAKPPAAPPAPAVPNPPVGGAAMPATRNVVENASAAPNLTIFSGALKTAGLAGPLSGPGPHTVFAPTNEAFGRLAPGTLETLLKPENRASLTRVLNYHVVPGAITAADLRRRIAAGGGSANLTTAANELLTARFENGAITLTDMNGTRTYVETPDVRQSNGVMHVINGVLAPRLG